MKTLKRKVIYFISNSTFLRTSLKLSIRATAKLIKLLPGKTYDIIFLADFKNNGIELSQQLGCYRTKYLQFNLTTIIPAIYYATHCKLLLVDNFNIIVASVPTLEATAIQYWHSTSAVKKFGLQLIDNQKQCNQRAKEMSNYNLIISNSRFMSEVFKNSFGFETSDIVELGSLCSRQLFATNNWIIQPQPYILYVPTFRWNDNSNDAIIEFINNFESETYILLYCLHPKINGKVTNTNCIQIENENVRNYLSNAKLVISDYSSLLVDASLVNPHVAMYVYDYETYSASPGLNITKNDFWGFAATNLTELENYLHHDNFMSHDTQWIKDKFFTYDDINSNKRIGKYLEQLLEQRKASLN